MSRLSRIVVPVGALALAGYALKVLLTQPVHDDGGAELPRHPPAQARAQADARERFIQYARAVEQDGSASIPGDDLVDDDDAPWALGPEGVGEDDARRGFDHIMRRVEAVGAKRRRLTQDEWRQTYRAANDAFSALSTHLDARDEEQRSELEEAYARLKSGLDGVRVKGDKFSGP
jgi:hypothetical protein